MRLTATIFLSNLMIFLAHLPFFALAIPSSASVLNITQLGPYIKPLPNTLNLHPLPNPFPIPNTDITLDFVAGPAPPALLSQNDLIECFALVKTQFETLIRDKGDGPIARRYRLTFGAVTLRLFSGDTPLLRMTYSEALSVVLGISLKMAREGYVRRDARVLETTSGDGLGAVVVSPVHT